MAFLRKKKKCLHIVQDHFLKIKSRRHWENKHLQVINWKFKILANFTFLFLSGNVHKRISRVYTFVIEKKPHLHHAQKQGSVSFEMSSSKYKNIFINQPSGFFDISCLTEPQTKISFSAHYCLNKTKDTNSFFFYIFFQNKYRWQSELLNPTQKKKGIFCCCCCWSRKKENCVEFSQWL